MLRFGHRVFPPKTHILGTWSSDSGMILGMSESSKIWHVSERSHQVWVLECILSLAPSCPFSLSCQPRRRASTSPPLHSVLSKHVGSRNHSPKYLKPSQVLPPFNCFHRYLGHRDRMLYLLSFSGTWGKESLF